MFAFIRHGQTDWNRDDRLQGASDIPLNDTGRAQAHEAAELLRDGGWQVIVSSRLSRARETAQIIADDLGLELGPAYEALAERDYGVLEGESSSATVARHPDRDYPGAESLASVVSRGTAALARIADDYRDSDVMIVCHGTIIRYTLSALAGFRLPGITNGSVSRFRLDGDRWRVLTVNGTPIEQIDPDSGAMLNA
ncbi:MAG TPA: histidine phosphatase family protein [Pseudolysinimonas sp.]|nr:histidine phosphatase family protein [Pseudolysinimonas sp.]